MSRPPVIERTALDLEALLAGAGRLQRLPALAGMQAHAQQARHILDDDRQWLQRPLQVALVGETGVGKSALFNALIGDSGASSTSDLRCHTEYPVVAVSPGDRERLHLDLDSARPPLVVESLVNLALIDTPDINGDIAEHHERARRVIERADVVIYITIPDQLADLSGLSELARWRGRTRFLFVINKMDRERRSGDDFRRDLAGRLHDLGFETPPSGIFLTSATAPEGTDLPRLRDHLLRRAQDASVSVAREINALGHLQAVLAPEALRPLAKHRAALEATRDDLSEDVRRIYAEALADAKIERLLRRMVRDQSFVEAGRISGWPMSAWFHLRNRFALVVTGYHAARLVSGGGLLRLLRASMSSLAAASVGVVPVMRLAEVLDDHLERRLRTVQTDVARTLEDYGLQPPPPPGAEPQDGGDPRPPVPESDTPAMRAARRGLSQRVAGAVVDETQHRLTEAMARLMGGRQPAAELVDPVRKAIANRGEETAERALGRVTRHLINLPPLLALIHIGWRIAESWVTANYLEWPFYPLALAVLLVSFVPGWLAVSWRLGLVSRRVDAGASVLEHLREHPVLRPLDAVIDELADFERRAAALARRIRETRRELNRPLPPELGETVVRDVSGPTLADPWERPPLQVESAHS